MVIWQLIIPMIMGTPVCPLFRRRRRAKLLVEVEHAREDLVEDTLEQQLSRLRARHTEIIGNEIITCEKCGDAVRRKDMETHQKTYREPEQVEPSNGCTGAEHNQPVAEPRANTEQRKDE